LLTEIKHCCGLIGKGTGAEPETLNGNVFKTPLKLALISSIDV
jgi:hypothetical protein